MTLDVPVVRTSMFFFTLNRFTIICGKNFHTLSFILGDKKACYTFGIRKQTFDGAMKTCADLGAQLITPKSEDEVKSLKFYLRHNGFLHFRRILVGYHSPLMDENFYSVYDNHRSTGINYLWRDG